jgi:hypothetical protein
MLVLLHLFTWIIWFSSKAEAQRPMAGEIVPINADVPPLSWVPLPNKRQRSGAWKKNSTPQGPCSNSVRDRGRGSRKVKTDKVLLYVDVGTSDELPLAIIESFKDGRYSPLIGVEEREWQILLEQFIASRVVVKNEVINIDSD